VRIIDLQTGEELVIGDKMQGAQIAWSRERDLLATGDRYGNVRLWNPVDGELIDLIGKHEYEVRDLAWEPGGERIASAGGDSSVRIIAVGEGAQSQTIQVNRNEMIDALSWSPEGGKLLINTHNWDDGYFLSTFGLETSSPHYSKPGSSILIMPGHRMESWWFSPMGKI